MASPVVLFGGTAAVNVPVLQPGQSTTYKRNGIAELRSVFKSFGAPNFVPIPLYTPYPDQSTGGFVCDETKVEGPDEGGFYTMSVLWVSINNQPTSYTTYDSKLIQVPIDQSPNFTTIAGTPASPLNGAVFDTNGVFVGFGPLGDGSPSPYQGVVSAFIQQDLLVIRGSATSPQIPSGQYFCESVSNTQRGAIFEYEITYNLDIAIDTGIPDSGN